jgi:hypothetical protein
MAGCCFCPQKSLKKPDFCAKQGLNPDAKAV